VKVQRGLYSKLCGTNPFLTSSILAQAAELPEEEIPYAPEQPRAETSEHQSVNTPMSVAGVDPMQLGMLPDAPGVST